MNEPKIEMFLRIEPGETIESPLMIYSDFSIETITADFVKATPRSKALLTDEGAVLFSGHNLKSETAAATLGSLTKLWDAGEGERKRRTDPEGSGRFWGCAFSAHIGTQPVIVTKVLTSPLMTQQGFLARFLIAAPQSLGGQRTNTLEQLDSAAVFRDTRMQKFWAWMKVALCQQQYWDEHGALKQQLLNPTIEAKAVWVAFYNHVERKQAKGQEYSGPMKPFAGRIAEHALRISAILAYLDCQDEINERHMENACKLAAYSLNTWHTLLVGSPEQIAVADARRLLQWFKQKPDKRTSKLVKQYGPIRKQPTRVENALNFLVEHDWIRGDLVKGFRVWGDA